VSDEEEATAYHEAGHSVAAITLGRSVVRVSIERDEFTLGRVEHRPRGRKLRPDVEADGRTRRAVNADIVVSWAGPLAEERFTGQFNEPGAQRDLDRSFDLALNLTVGDMDEAAAYVEWLRFRTIRLMREPNFWPQVQAVADALVKHRSLSGVLVRHIMATAARRVVAGRWPDSRPATAPPADWNRGFGHERSVE
jgi:hypothetical protein